MTCIACGSPQNYDSKIGYNCANNNCARHNTANAPYDYVYASAAPFTLLSWPQGKRLYELAQQVPKGTAMAELGVYKGGSALIMRKGNNAAPLYLFDTFQGHPVGNREKDYPGTHPPGSLGDTSAAQVQQLLNYDCHCIVGEFPESLEYVNWTHDDAPRLGLLHIDVDLYNGCIAGLTYLAPLIVPGGSIVLDDWRTHDCPGVVAAVEEWAEIEHLPNPVTRSLPSDSWQCIEEAYPSYQLVMTKRS